MKYKCWPLRTLLGLCILFLRCHGGAGDDYLDVKEQQLEQFKKQSIANYEQRCELLATCGNPTNCSHDVCAPLLGDEADLTCMVVHNNQYCIKSGTSNRTCTNLNLDFTRGNVRDSRGGNDEPEN